MEGQMVLIEIVIYVGQHQSAVIECLTYHYGISYNVTSDQETSAGAWCPFFKALGLSLTELLSKLKGTSIRQTATPPQR